MVEVFKTDVQEVAESDVLVQELLVHFPSTRITFDIDDCDRVLRLQGSSISPSRVVEILAARGYLCDLLD